MRIGFIGIGLMGLPLCRRLLGAGLPLTVWNRGAEKCLPLVTAGARQATDIADLTRQSDVIMICVADTAAVEQVVFNGIAEHGAPGKVVVDLSSIDPAATRAFAARLHAACGMAWVDAPVSGGVRGAESGTLVIMAGGEQGVVEKIRPLLAPLAQRVTRMGPVGAGQVTKVCNQMIVATNALLIAETVALAEKAGVDATLLAPALAGGFADSLPFQILAPRMAARSFEPVQWKVQTLLKDLRNAATLSAATHSEIPLAAHAAELMQAHAENGFATADLSTVIKHYKN